MATREISTTIKLDGEKAFNDSMKSVNSNLKSLKAEMAATSAEFRHNADSVEALTAKQKLQQEMYDQQAEKIRALEGAISDLTEAGQTESAAMDRYRNELARAKAAQANYEDALNETTTALNDAQAAAEDTAGAIEETGSAAEEAGGSTENWADKLSGAVVKGNLLSNAISWLVGKVKEFIASMWHADEATEEFRIAQGQINTAFETAGSSAGAAKKAYGGFFAVLGDSGKAAEATQLLAKLAGSTQNTSVWAKIASGVMGSFGDALPIPQLIEAANETANVGKVTGVLADSLVWVGISESNFNSQLAACATTEERAALITQTLADAYSNAASSYQKNNSTLIEARQYTLDVEAAQASLGEEVGRLKNAFRADLTPAITSVIEGAAKLIGTFADVKEAMNSARDAVTEPYETESLERATELLAEMQAEYDAMSAQDKGLWTSADEIAYSTLEIRIGMAKDHIQALKEAAEQPLDISTPQQIADMAVENFKLSAEQLIAQYQQTYDAAYESISGQFGLFDTLATEVTLSVDDMMASLKSQTDYMTTYAENLQTAARIGIDEGLIASLSDGSAQSAGYISEIVAEYQRLATESPEAAQAMVDGLNGNFEASRAAMESYADAVSESVNGTTEKLQEMANEAATQIGNLNLGDEAHTAAVSTLTEYISGLDGMMGPLSARLSNISAAISEAFNVSVNVPGIPGFATGLDYVPYDNFLARLHKGEMVLTASEAASYRKGDGEDVRKSVSVVINAPSIDKSTVDYIVERVNRELGA